MLRIFVKTKKAVLWKKVLASRYFTWNFHFVYALPSFQYLLRYPQPVHEDCPSRHGISFALMAIWVVSGHDRKRQTEIKQLWQFRADSTSRQRRDYAGLFLRGLSMRPSSCGNSRAFVFVVSFGGWVNKRPLILLFFFFFFSQISHRSFSWHVSLWSAKIVCCFAFCVFEEPKRGEEQWALLVLMANFILRLSKWGHSPAKPGTVTARFPSIWLDTCWRRMR